MIVRTALVFAASSIVSFAAVRSGKATAEWITASSNAEPGKPVRTGLRLVLDEKWHTYWSNPGEGGMEISVKWDLPEGWTVGNLQYPVPKRFMTGDLPGFGYEGTVIFPVDLNPPAGFSGEAKLKAKISWLTCNDDSCIPGDAELELLFKSGTVQPTPAAGEIDEAFAQIPRTREGMILEVKENSGTLSLSIVGGTGDASKISDYEVFPATPTTVDAGAEFKFVANGEKWTADVAKNEYASGPIKELTLVLSKKGNKKPISLVWKES